MYTGVPFVSNINKPLHENGATKANLPTPVANNSKVIRHDSVNRITVECGGGNIGRTTQWEYRYMGNYPPIPLLQLRTLVQ